MNSDLVRVVFVLGMFAGSAGCASSASPRDGQATAEGSTGSEACEGYSVTDPCMNEDNFAQCQQRAAACPGAVRVLESCPLQFRCP